MNCYSAKNLTFKIEFGGPIGYFLANFGRETNSCSNEVLSPHIDAQQNFRILWVGLHSWGNKEACLDCTIKSVIFKHV